MEYFVRPDSIVRRIWGSSEPVLFIFAGASAEFALNKAVDWLYFTGRLPADPLGRLFSTVGYAQRIIYLPYDEAIAAIDSIGVIHKGVETRRQANIPQSSYRDVLYMLIDYTVRVHETFEGSLSQSDKDEIFDVFHRMGKRMGIEALPATYDQWLLDREEHLRKNLKRSKFTDDLYARYRQSLGVVRYWLLLQVQRILCPPYVRDLLGFKQNATTPLLLGGYKACRVLKLDGLLRLLFLPAEYKEEIKGLNRHEEVR